MKHRIAVLGDFDRTNPRHVATRAAVEHSSAALGVSMEAAWILTSEIEIDFLSRFAGIWVAPGSPYRDMARVISAIRYARERKIPCFGTCGGFQHMILEYARNVLHYQDAQHAEYEPYASDLFISKLDCSLVGRALTLSLAAGSKIATIYGSSFATEEYYCDFGVNPLKVGLLKGGSLRVTASDPEGEIRVIELPDHPFFIGTLFVPQMRSTSSQPHPLVTSFVRCTADSAHRVANFVG